jgi:hypothetical protein
MTIAQFLSFLIMPVGGLLMGLIALFLTRHDRRDKHG